ncbi:MAG: hypothetical protein HY717_11435 [Planctomycetes bacterium]|nr:hypothetical protein [Planctomycetota bacterium]
MRPLAPRKKSAPARRRAGPGLLRLGALAAAAGLFFLASCAGRSEFLSGQIYFQQGQYKSAYLEYHRALQLDPDAEEYLQSLEKVGKVLAMDPYLEGEWAERTGDLDTALEKFTIAWEYAPRFALVLGALHRLGERQAEGEALAGFMSAWREPGSWKKVLELLRLPGLPEAHPRLWLLAMSALLESTSRLLESAEKGLAAAPPEADPDWRELHAALEEVRLELEARPGQAPASLGEALRGVEDRLGEALEWQSRREAAERISQEAEKQIAGGKLEAGWRLYERAWWQAPENPVFRDRRDELLDRWTGDLLAAARLHLQREEWEAALDPLQRILDWRADSRAEELLARCHARLRERLVQEARRYRELGLPGLALGSLIKARKHPAAGSLEPEIESAARALRREAQPPFQLEQPALDEGEVDFNEELWKVRRDLLADFENRVRQAFQKAFPEKTGCPEKTGAGSDPLEKGAVVLRLSNLDFDTALLPPSGGTAEVWILEGLEEVTNPSYFEVERGYDRLRRLAGEPAVENGGQSGAATGLLIHFPRRAGEDIDFLAESRLERLSASLVRMPQKSPRAVWSRHSYPVLDHTWLAKLRVRVELEGHERWVEAGERFEDRQVEGMAQWGIQPDPLEFPPREEVFRKLAGALAKRLAAQVKKMFQERVERFFDRAEERFRMQEVELALENLVRYCYGCWALYGEKAGKRARRLEAALETLERIGGFCLPRN